MLALLAPVSHLETFVTTPRLYACLPRVLCRYFLVPDPPAPTPIVPYTRVNHAKWMVTDNAVYVGTSNWYGVGTLGAVASVGVDIVDCKK